MAALCTTAQGPGSSQGKQGPTLACHPPWQVEVMQRELQELQPVLTSTAEQVVAGRHMLGCCQENSTVSVLVVHCIGSM